MLFDHLIEIHDQEPHPAALNMALDEALLYAATTATLRIYRWSTAAISIGYFERFENAEREASGRQMVRRWTGGGLVEHGTDLTYTLVVPSTVTFSRAQPAESYRLIHSTIASLLGTYGVTVYLAPEATGGAAGPCFTRHVQYDVLSPSGKVAGAAQRRTRHGLLHQGSIHLSNAAPPGRSVLSLLAQGLGEAFAHHVERAELTLTLKQKAQDIAEAKYGTEAWMRRF